MTVDTKGKLTFPGGVHPPENKHITCESPIEQGPAPKQLAVMLCQNIGAPCEPIVTKGDNVQAGQKIGDSEAFVSAPVHSPVNGRVKDIALASHIVLGRSPAVIIDVDEQNTPKYPVSENFSTDAYETKYSPEQICDAIRNAGLVGMGGAGFPTRVKVQPNPKSPKHTLIINGCECEPYITSDYRIMLEWTSQIIAGIRLATKASGCKNVFVGIEDNKPKAIEIMTDALRKTSPNGYEINVVPVKTKYPQGGERQLIKSVLDTYVPTGGIPPMIGVLVLNMATTAAIAEAVVYNRPLTHRVVTVTGQAIAKPGNFYVPIGTTVKELIDFCGGLTQKGAKVILGGPMMGIAVGDLSTPITKTTGAITVLTKDQIGRAKFQRRQTPCIRCGRCIEVCPENLNPTKIAHAVRHNLMDLAESYYITGCMECGCCSYVCPANIELTGLIKTGKILLAKQKQKMLK
jgi:electron transport complex protein RnfC